MIAFGSSIGDAEAYRRYAEPGVRLAAEPDSELYVFAAVESVSRSYNLILDAAARRHDLEGLVLVHPHTEIADPDFCTKLRRTLSDPDVGVAGAIGAAGVNGIAWWEGSVSSAPTVHRYEEHGGGDLAAFAWAHPTAAFGEVDTVDGLLLVIAPWIVRHVRFDESLNLGYGYDLDYCLQVRATGRKVVTADFRTIHHRSLELVKDLELWTEAHIRMAEKWDGRLVEHGVDEADWKRRARRAEAEREAARAYAFSNALKRDARVLELELALAEKTDSASWRITAPLRQLNQLLRERLKGRVNPDDYS